MRLSGTCIAGVLGASLLASACVRPPASLDIGALPEITLEQARDPAYAGRRVRWGGEIVAANPGEKNTCFEVVQRPLDRAARPLDTDESVGRFRACAAGFYDPVIYAPGRDITVVGTVQQPATDRIGEREYDYATLAAEVVYLWAKREARPRVYYIVEPWPYYGPYFPYGYGWYPYWQPHRHR
jgi:outer membrane lipoprotein